MSNVVHAFGSASVTELQEEMLRKLEQLADDVRSGRIVAIGLCSVTNDGSVTRAWHRQAGTHFTLLGAIENLRYELLRVLD